MKSTPELHAAESTTQRQRSATAGTTNQDKVVTMDTTTTSNLQRNQSVKQIRSRFESNKKSARSESIESLIVSLTTIPSYIYRTIGL